MESLRQAFFEDPLYVYVFLAVAELVVVALCYQQRTSRRIAAMLVCPVLAVVVFAVAALVVTDREQITAAMHEIAQDIQAGSFEKAAEYLDDELTGHYGDKAKAAEHGREMIKTWKIRSVRFLKPHLEIDAPRADLRVTTIVELDTPAGLTRLGMKWDIAWIKRDYGWRIREVSRPEQGVDLRSAVPRRRQYCISLAALPQRI